MIGISEQAIFEPAAGKVYVLSVDPGLTSGWALGKYEAGRFAVSALGTLPAENFLEVCRKLAYVIHHLIIEEPAARGTPGLHTYVGQILEAFHPSAKAGKLELYKVPPGVWKQYPKKKVADATTELLGVQGVLNTPHVRDAMGLLAWWWITTGREVLSDG